MKQVPFLLVYSRLLIGLVIGLIALVKPPDTTGLIVSLMTIGLTTDIMDGIIARKAGVATEKLRVWDSNTDQFFWIVVLTSVFSLHTGFIREHYLPIVLILMLEASTYLLSYLRFRRTVATHSLLAKSWTLTLFAFLADLAWDGQSTAWFWIAVVLGVISRLEILLMMALMKKWTTDVASVFSLGKAKKIRS